MKRSAPGLLARLAFFVLCLFALSASGDAILSARVVSITDGDTIHVELLQKNDRVQVRLAGIDAPEGRQPFGEEATRALGKLLYGHSVYLEGQKTDRYGRLIAKVVVGEVDAGLELIRQGLAWHYKTYEREQSSADRIAYATAENNAKQQQLGLWTDQNPIAPWDWRSRSRQGVQQGGDKGMETIEALKVEQPFIGLLLQILVVGLLAAGIWFVFSVVFALLYSALRESIARAAGYFGDAVEKLLLLGNKVWQNANESISAFIRQLSAKWIFADQDSIFQQRISVVRRTVTDVGQRIELGLREMRSSMDSFRAAVEGLAVPASDFVHVPGQTTTDQIRDAARARRTSLVVLIFVTPILFALVTLNTAMLTKFFESFIDEWLSFRWGVKISTVLGLFLSVLEIALGVLIYYFSRRKDARSIVPAMMQLLLVALVALLALIEAYLYYRLSLEMTAERAGAAMIDGLPAWIHSAWLAPFGPVLVVALSTLGHVLISAINQFVDAGLQKSQQRILDEIRQTWTSLMKSGAELQSRVSEVRARCIEFIGGLKDADDPTTAVAVVEDSLRKLSSALDAAKKMRLNPYVSIDESEARRTFAVLTLKAAALVIVGFFFCWVQLLYEPANEFASFPFVLIAGAIVQAAAVLIASYKIHSQVILLIDGQPGEVLHGSRELWTTSIAIGCLVAVIVYNSALGGAFRPESFQWIPFLLSLVCTSAFALIGRTVPAVTAAAKVWIKVMAAVAIAMLVWAAALLCWICKIAVLGLKALLYALAYPFLLVFWRKKLEPSEEQALERK